MILSAPDVLHEVSEKKVRVFVRKKRATKTLQAKAKVVKPEMNDEKVRFDDVFLKINEESDFQHVLFCVHKL